MKPFTLLCLSIFLLAGARGQTARHDTTRVYSLIDVAKEKQQRGEADSAEYYFKQAGTLAEKLDFDNGRLAYTNNYSAFLYEQIRYEEALAVAKELLALSLKLNNRQRAASGYNNMALQYQAQGKLQQAAESLMKALEISAEIVEPSEKDLSDRRKYYNNLSSLLLDMNDLDKGLSYAWKAFEIAEQLKDTLAMGRSLVNVMVAEAMANRLTDAEEHGLQYLAIGQSFGDVQMELRAYSNLSDIYRRQKRYQLALDTYQKAQRLLKKAPPGNEVYILSGISSVYKEMGRHAQADVYFEKALAIAEKELAKPQLIELYLSGAEIKEGMGDYKAALSFRKQYEKINDSLRNQETHHTIQELEVKYQTAEKERALAERDLKISGQRSELERKNTWVILSILLVAILALTLLFNRLISRQKLKTEATEQANRLLEAQLQGEETERARTARELHDGVASILSAAKLRINAMEEQDPYANSMLGQLIETAVQEIRNISHNLAPEAILDEGFEHAVQEFCRRVNHPGMQLECYVVGELPKLGKNAELLLYRIIQEAVANMVKHAEATEGIVQLVGEGPRLSITIEDNGKGFDPKTRKATGIGLKNLASRIQLLHGSQEVHSAPGKGTSIYIEIDTGKVVQSAGAGVEAQYTG
ncbi:tetratricopeptide repeat protein [Parapedobacter deserti]|uniref:Oxygen sensor histidine kinase NreB n=1 Tax=Parapedobacter deserti TaxID=1912957 RepID=A0ABV7JFZ6_9SPHI